MIKAYMQADLNNALAMRYIEYALKSFECVSDIFEIEVVQCITPDNLLPELKNTPYWHGNKKRSPGELGSYHSNYRMMKRLASGERFWVMEHDAWLNPEREDIFRKFMGKCRVMEAMLIGTATEIWTVSRGVAIEHCKIVENGTKHGTMETIHKAVNIHCRNINLKSNRVYWPLFNKQGTHIGRVNKTGIGNSADVAFRRPRGIIENAPCTQLVDPNYGASIQDRANIIKNKKSKTLIDIHKDLHFISLDNM